MPSSSAANLASRGHVIVIAPHPDDETLAAGGLLYDLSRRGWTASVIVVSDGARSHPGTVNLATIREAECRRAAIALGLASPPVFLGFPDGGLADVVPLIAEELIAFLQGTDLVIVPRADDGHDDHRAVAHATDIALRNLGTNASSLPRAVWRFAVWGWDLLSEAVLDEPHAERFLLTSDARLAKSRALAEYVSQTTAQFGQTILSNDMLNNFRGSDEVFWC
jgi:LmbE family N-acetylglucosaminyl deacetylase